MLDAARWYEQRHAGLDDRFLDAVRSTAERIGRWPNVGVPAHIAGSDGRTVRRIATLGFPYVIEYTVVDQALLVLAVHHERRRPQYWADRTDETTQDD